jgi:ribosomal protein S18 acetylase RimI-like enzyme
MARDTAEAAWVVGSRVWPFTAALRRAGYGAKILQEYLDRGAADGFRRFRLAVWAENRPAIGLYRSFGFQAVRELRNERAGMTYLNMALELREDDEGRSIRGRD